MNIKHVQHTLTSQIRITSISSILPQDFISILASLTLEPPADGLISCDSHEYYYQVQGQLSVCEKDFCDFVFDTTGHPCRAHYSR